MDESAWQECGLLYELLALVRKRMNDRQRRLFALACCERFVSHLLDVRSQSALAVARQFADGFAEEGDLRAAEQHASAAFIDLRDSRMTLESGIVWTRQSELLAQAALLLVSQGIYYAEDAADCVRWALLSANGWRSEQAEEEIQCTILRDIVGPIAFRNPVLQPVWLLYNEGAARMLAEHIAADRDYETFPILADALEEAGCSDELILNHCRQPGHHVAGCWVLDLILQER